MKQIALKKSEGTKRGIAAVAAGGGGGGDDDRPTGNGDSGLIKGLKRAKTPEPEKPYDPFGGYVPDKRDYYTLRDFYPSSHLEPLRHDVRVQAGGYNLQEYYSRAMFEAFAGLGCFIDDEISKREKSSASASQSLNSEGAAVAAVSR